MRINPAERSRPRWPSTTPPSRLPRSRPQASELLRVGQRCPLSAQRAPTRWVRNRIDCRGFATQHLSETPGTAGSRVNQWRQEIPIGHGMLARSVAHSIVGDGGIEPVRSLGCPQPPGWSKATGNRVDMPRRFRIVMVSLRVSVCCASTSLACVSSSPRRRHARTRRRVQDDPRAVHPVEDDRVPKRRRERSR